MTTKSLGRGFKITAEGKVEKVPVYHSVSQRLKAKRTNRTKVRVKRPGERSR